MFRARCLPSSQLLQQISRRSLAQQVNVHQADNSGSESPLNEQGSARKNINRVYLSGTVTGKPFYGTAKNGVNFGVVRIISNSFGGQFDFRVRLGTRASITYCKENVNEGSHLFVFGRLATFPRIAADGTQGSSGTIMASRISVEQGSASNEDHLEDVDFSTEDDLERSEPIK